MRYRGRQPSVVLALSACLFLAPSFALAQSTPAAPPPPAAEPPPERFGIGGAVGARIPGAFAFALVRASAPLTPKVGIDIDLGQLRRTGRIVSAQVRYLFKGRRADGRGGYLIVGATSVRNDTRTEIRWPDGRIDVTIDRARVVVPQVGYGWDVLLTRGARLGVEVTTGGGEKTGPMPMAKAFVLWGPGAI
jgi:hypothetical protein